MEQICVPKILQSTAGGGVKPTFTGILAKIRRKKRFTSEAIVVFIWCYKVHVIWGWGVGGCSRLQHAACELCGTAALC